ncbi:hypothetical protein [Providencia sp.]|uniref:hypothetical protein n=1 Tax=Providencia sp. TaxID=589 RepID=UPI00333E9BB4
MNPFLSKRFLLLTVIFVVSLLSTFFIFVRGSVVAWQIENHQENGSAIAYYDWASTFQTENGILIVTQKSQSSNYYSSYNPYTYAAREYDYQVLFADNQGVRFITRGDKSFYNAVCERKQCLLFLRDGYQTIDLTTLSASKVMPWEDKSGVQFAGLITGKIYQSKNYPAYVVANNEKIFVSQDKGMTWEHFMDVRDLAKSLYPEEIDSRSEFTFATYRDKVVMWYSYGHQMGSLEVVMDIPSKQVVSSKWLPVRINEAAQNLNGDIFVIAQEPSRKLFSLMQYETNGSFKLLAETGYNYLSSLKVGKQGLAVTESVRGSTQLLTMDVQTNEISHRSELPMYKTVFNGGNKSFIELESMYSEDIEITEGSSVSYQSMH